MKNDWQKIFEESSCPEPEMLVKYASGTLGSKECHYVEKHVMDCAFCADALEGLELHQKSGGNLEQRLGELGERVMAGNSGKEYRWQWAAAAAIAFLIAAGSMVLFDQNTNQQKLLAEANEVNNNKEATTEDRKEEKQEVLQKNEAAVIDSSAGEHMKAEDQKAELLAEAQKAKHADQPVEAEKDTELLVAALEDLRQEDNQASTAGGAAVYSNALSMDEEIKIDASSEEIADAETARPPAESNRTMSRAAAEEEVAMEVLEREKKNKKAAARAQSATAPIPASGEARPVANEVMEKTAIEEALDLYALKMYQSAGKKFEEVLLQEPQNPQALHYAGLSKYNAGDESSAINYFNKVIAQGSGEYYEEALWYKGLILKKQGKIGDANAAFDEVIKIGGKYQKHAKQELR